MTASIPLIFITVCCTEGEDGTLEWPKVRSQKYTVTKKKKKKRIVVWSSSEEGQPIEACDARELSSVYDNTEIKMDFGKSGSFSGVMDYPLFQWIQERKVAEGQRR